jgi:hypothetical protein
MWSTEAPWFVETFRDAYPLPGDHRHFCCRPGKGECRAAKRPPVDNAVYPQCLRQTAWSRTQKTEVRAAATFDHATYVVNWFNCADKNRASSLADEVQTPMEAVGAIHVGVAGRSEHGRIADSLATEAVRSWIIECICFSFDNDAAYSVETKVEADQFRRDMMWWPAPE